MSSKPKRRRITFSKLKKIKLLNKRNERLKIKKLPESQMKKGWNKSKLRVSRKKKDWNKSKRPASQKKKDWSKSKLRGSQKRKNCKKSKLHAL